MSTFASITPASLGLPPKFSAFRGTQIAALDWLDGSESEIFAALLPTGVGKTSFAFAYGRHLIARQQTMKAVYLVATKALEKQVMDDFEVSGMRNLHGRRNYDCPRYQNCDDGFDHDCSLSGTGDCGYSNAVEKATYSNFDCSNYAYWLHSKGTRNKAFAGTGFLICDEAHSIEGQLSGFASVKLYARELGSVMTAGRVGINGVVPDEADDWKQWAMKRAEKLEEKAGGHELTEDEEDLLDRLHKVVRMHSNWTWQFDDRGHVTFEPVRITAYAKKLYGSVPRTLFMSASLTEFTFKMLLPADAPFEYRAWPSSFPQQNAPVYHIPTRKLSWKSTDEDYKAVLEAADAIIDRRLDRKGIIHTVSYARSRRALAHSRHAARFIWNDTGAELAKKLEQFRASGPGSLLVTPSVEEGFDFPADQCEYQIVLKFPFPNETQRVVKERCAQIPGYRLHYAAQKLVQMRGRPVRSETDRAELFILDNAVKQLCGPEGRSYCPPGFRIFTVAQVPPAPAKM